MSDVSSVSPQSANPTKVKPPVLVQIIVVLMWLSGFGIILQGIFWIFFFGIGIAFIVLGVLVIRYANDLNKMLYRGYKGSLIVNGLILVLTLIGQYFAPVSVLQFSLEIILSVAFLVILYLYRGSFLEKQV